MHPTAREARASALRQALAHTGPPVIETIPIPGTSTRVEVARPADTDRLLDQIAADPEQNLPYWAEIWPSGIALAAAIARHPDRIQGRRVLELGSGSGITAAIAVACSGAVTVTDYAPEALLLTSLTCLQHCGREPDRALRLNWRDDLPNSLGAEGPFDVVLGADLLYERRDIEPLLAVVNRLVAPDGALWLAEPGRTPARDFVRALSASGWDGESCSWDGPWPDAGDAGVTVRTHWLRRSGAHALDSAAGPVS